MVKLALEEKVLEVNNKYFKYLFFTNGIVAQRSELGYEPLTTTPLSFGRPSSSIFLTNYFHKVQDLKMKLFQIFMVDAYLLKNMKQG